MKKLWLSFILVAAMALTMMSTTAYAADNQNDISIVFTNDVHCKYLTYDKVASVAKDADLLIDSGDFLSGDVIGTLSEGEGIIKIMNCLGYDLVVPGNHDFDFTIPRLLELSEKSNFDYISCNFMDNKGASIFDPYRIFEVKGRKIALVGITTPMTFTTSTPVFFQDTKGNYIYSFSEGGENGENLMKVVQNAVDAARNEGAEYIIGVGHMGVNQSSYPWTVENLISGTNGIDAFVDGHSHNTYTDSFKNKDGREVPAIQSGTGLEYCGKIVIDTKGKITVENIELAGIEADAQMTEYIASITDELNKLQDKVVARTTIGLTILGEDGKRAVRKQETNLGDFCADAYKSQMGADVAIINGGGIRTDIAPGDITYGNLISVHPFGNLICLAEVSGQQILDALEHAYSKVPEENGGFLQTSGLTCTINTAIPSHVVLNEKAEFVRVDGQRRVSDVKINGVDLDPKARYKLATTDFIVKECGDGFAMFGTNNTNLLKDCVMVDNQALINYIIDDLKGVVGSQYRTSRNSLNIIYDEALADTAAETAHTYVVVDGDCLWKIAEKCYGDGSLGQLIYNENRSIISNPNILYAGQELVIPAA